MNGIIQNSIILASAQMEPRLFDLDFQLLADALLMVIAVLVLFFVASYFLFNPARAVLEKRQSKIREELEKAAKDLGTAASLKKEYDDRLKNIDAQAEIILSEARKKALSNESKLIAEAKEEAARIMERARMEAELEKQKAVDDIKREIIDIAALMAGKVVSASMNITIQDSMINETLKEMGESTWLS